MTDRTGPLGDELRRLGDELRARVDLALRFPCDDVHHTEHFRHLRHLAADVFALADERSGEQVEREVFSGLTHLAPVACVDAAVFDPDGRVLLIQRADDGLWALPGGMVDVGETIAEGAVRETAEEAGWDVRPLGFVGAFDSRRCGMPSPLQLVVNVVHCAPVAPIEAGPSTPHEVLDVGWFAGDGLPALSAGHHVRVPHAVAFHRGDAGVWLDVTG